MTFSSRFILSRLLPLLVLAGLLPAYPYLQSLWVKFFPELVPGVVYQDDDRTSGNYLAGMFASKRNQLDVAAHYLERSLGQTPDNPELLETTYKTQLLSGDVDGAIVLAKRFHALKPDSITANMLLAVEGFHQRDYAAAAKVLNLLQQRREIHQEGSDLIFIPFMITWAEAGQRNYDEAIRQMQEFMENSGAPLLLHYHHLALLYDMAGRTDEAEIMFEKGLKTPRLPYRFLQSAGNFFERHGKPERAERLYKAYRTQHGNSAFFNKELARIKEGKTPEKLIDGPVDAVSQLLMEAISLLYENNLYQEGLAYLQMVLYLKPGYDQAYLLLGVNDEQQELYEQAIEAYKKIPEDSDFYRQAQVSIAYSLAKLNRLEEAEDYLLELIDRDPDNIANYLALADLYRSSEEFRKAIKYYSRAIDKIERPTAEHWALFYARGICYERNKKWGKAEADFLRSLELQPDQPEVLNYLAYSWVEQGINLEKARVMLEKALRQTPDDPHIIDSMGWVLFKLGKYQEAVDFLEKAILDMPYDPTVNEHLGDVYWKVGRKIEAKFQWQRALDGKPDEEDVTRRLKQKLVEGV